jgi:hypothetical protein
MDWDKSLELLRILSRALCTGHLAGKSGPELGRLLGVGRLLSVSDDAPRVHGDGDGAKAAHLHVHFVCRRKLV